MGERMHIVYSSSLTEIKDNNSSFDYGILRIAYTGKNPNGSSISKEAFESSLSTLANCPIVCHYEREENSIGGHDIELAVSDNGDMHIVNLTEPVGVVPESAKQFWESVKEDDGTIHEYLCTEVLLWKRQEAYRKIKADGITKHSMEITVIDGHKNTEDNVYVIDKFEFTALCLLGDGVTPCFASSELEVFSYNNFKEKMKEMMEELRSTFTQVSSLYGVDDITNQSKEGGDKALDEKLNLVAEFGLNIDDLDFAINDFTVDELRAKFEEMSSNEEDNLEDESEQNFELNSNLRDELRNAVCAEMVQRCWGEEPRYWMVDFDTELMQVYCEDGLDWKLYSFTYSMDGDNVVIDFASRKRMKWAIVEFDEGSRNAELPLVEIYDGIEKQYSAADNNWQEKYQEQSKQVESMTGEIDELRQFKLDTENAIAEAERNQACEGVFAKFEDLNGIDAFEELRGNNAEYSIEDLEEKCYAIRGKNNTAAKFSMDIKPAKLAVVHDEDVDSSNEPYNGVFKRYGY